MGEGRLELLSIFFNITFARYMGTYGMDAFCYLF